MDENYTKTQIIIVVSLIVLLWLSVTIFAIISVIGVSQPANELELAAVETFYGPILSEIETKGLTFNSQNKLKDIINEVQFRKACAKALFLSKEQEQEEQAIIEEEQETQETIQDPAIKLSSLEQAPVLSLHDQHFDTHKVYYTLYGEDSKWGRRCASPYRDSLISIDEVHYETVNGETYICTSIASKSSVGGGVIPFGSIIYVRELKRYFIVDDNAYSKKTNYKYKGKKYNCEDRQTLEAWDLGCSIWIDIFMGLDTGYLESGTSLATYEKILGPEYGLYSGRGILTFDLIRWGV